MSTNTPLEKPPIATTAAAPAPMSTAAQAAMSTFRLLQVCVTANLGGLLAGVHLALFSGILENEHFVHDMSPDTGVLSSMRKSIITTMLVIGFCAASPVAGTISDGWGRRPTLLIAASLFSISGVLTLMSTYFVNLGRFIAGAAYAIVNVVCPMYTAEIAPPATRGMLVNLYQLSITVGIVLAQTCNLILADVSWTGSITCSIVPALIMLALVWLVVPESPIWLANRFAHSTASTNSPPNNSSPIGVKVSTSPVPVSSSSSLSTASSTTDTIDIENQTCKPQSFQNDAMQANDREKAPSLRSLILDRSARRRLMIGSGLAAAQQWSGINAVIFFAPAIVNDVLKWSGNKASLQAAVLIGLANMVATVVSIVLVDRYGRRTLLLAGGAPMAACLVALSAMKSGFVEISAFMGITSLVTYVVAFAITYGPLPFVISSEIFPLRYKGIGMSFCSGVQGLGSLFVGLTFLPLLDAVGGGVYLIYAACMVAAIIFVYRVVPETRKLTLQEIDELLEQKVSN